MTETEHLIRQAARELQIAVTVTVSKAEMDVKTLEVVNTYKVQFVRNNGDIVETEIVQGTAYPAIHEALKAAYKGKE